MIRRLADLAESYFRGRMITAEHAGMSELLVEDLVALELDWRREATPEQRAAQEGARQ